MLRQRSTHTLALVAVMLGVAVLHLAGGGPVEVDAASAGHFALCAPARDGKHCTPPPRNPACELAKSDACIDTDGAQTKGDGFAMPLTPGSIDVVIGAKLSTFPVAVFNNSGLGWFDNDGDARWTFGPRGDDLHLEGTAFCVTGLHDGFHELPDDCTVLDYNASLFTGQPVSFDLESAGTPDAAVMYYDGNANGSYDDGEDIAYDVNGNGIFD